MKRLVLEVAANAALDDLSATLSAPQSIDCYRRLHHAAAFWNTGLVTSLLRLIASHN
jgi:hypothetical protein